MGFHFVKQPLALGRLNRFKQTVKHDYVLTGKYRLARSLRTYPLDEIDVSLFRAIFEDHTLWQLTSETRRRCDVYLFRVSRTETVGLKNRWPP